MNHTDSTDSIANLLDCTDDLLGRLGASLDHVVAATVAPHPGISLWHPSTPMRVAPLLELDGAGAVLLAAAASVVETMLNNLPADARATVAEALVDGGRLELLVSPVDSGAALRLTKGGRAVEIGVVAAERSAAALQ